MDYTSLIAEFSASYDLGDLVPDENGATGFEADGRPVIIQKLPDSEAVIITVDLGPATAASEAAVNRLLLQANQALQTLDGIAFCLYPEANSYCLLCRLDIAALDFIAFDEKMSVLLDRAEQWSTFLQKFIPLASAKDDDALTAAEPDNADKTPAKKSAPSLTGWSALRGMTGSPFAR